MPCLACGAAVEPVIDLGPQPTVSSFPNASDPPGKMLPLRLGMCPSCGLAQLADRSSTADDEANDPWPQTSAAMTAHSREFVDDLVARGLVGPNRRILSLASHGGHLVPFLRERGFSATIMEGVEPHARRLAAAGERVVLERLDAPSPGAESSVGSFDLVVESYLLAHLGRPRAALARMAALLAPGGTLALEFDDLLAKVEGGQWDAIGHSHVVYLSLGWLARELEAVGLVVFDAVSRPVFGGVLRVFARAGGRPGPSVEALLAHEASAAITVPGGLAPLVEVVARARRDVVPYLQAARAAGRKVAGYGAPTRAITFLNTLEIGPDLLPFVVDSASAKQGRTVPGVRIPILAPDALVSEPPDAILILTWNLVPEVRSALAPLVAGGTRLLVAVPGLADVTFDVTQPAS